MKNKCNGVNNTCGNTQLASCTLYEGSTNENSPLKEDCSLSTEETTQDIYDQLEDINLSELGDKCLEYVETEEGKIIVKNVLYKFEEEICNLKQQLEESGEVNICNKSIVECNLNFNGLVDECGEQPQTLSELLQLILNTISQ